MKKLYIILLMAVVFISAAAQTSVHKLSNGIDVVYEYSKSRDISAISFFFDGGTLNYKPDKAGVDKLLLQVIEKGTQKYPADSLNRLMDKYGIQTESASQYDYSYITMTSINKYFEQTVDIMTDMLRAPLLDEKTIELEKQKMLAEISRSEENPDDYVWDLLNEYYYAGHPYSAKPDGMVESVNSLNRDDLKAYLDKITKQGRIVVAIVSGIDPKVFIPYLEKGLGVFSSPKSISDFAVPAFDLPKEDVMMNREKDDLMTAYVAAKYDIPSILDKEYPQIRIGLSVLNKRVYEILRTKHGLTYAPFVGASMRKANYGYFLVSTDYPDSAISLTKQEFENVKKNGVTMEEINGIRNLYETSFYMQNEKASTKAYQIGYDYLTYKDFDYTNKFMETIKKMKAKDLNPLFKAYLKNYKFLILQ